MDKLTIKIWDVQHGSAAYICTPNGKHIVVDLGTGDVSGNDSLSYETFSPLRHLYKNYGIRQLDEVIITHPHTDHIDDIENFDLLKPISLLAPRHIPEEDIRKGNRPGDAPKIDKYLELLKRYNYTLPEGSDVNFINNNGGLDIRVFAPIKCGTYNLNNQSKVVFFSYAGSTICIPGDNERASWRELLENYSFKLALLKTNVFVASHHGRESGFYDELFEYLKPAIVIISDGPKGDTCVADKYRAKSSGWNVYSRSKSTFDKRFVLTTRYDGAIEIECYSLTSENRLDIETE